MSDKFDGRTTAAYERGRVVEMTISGEVLDESAVITDLIRNGGVTEAASFEGDDS